MCSFAVHHVILYLEVRSRDYLVTNDKRVRLHVAWLEAMSSRGYLVAGDKFVRLQCDTVFLKTNGSRGHRYINAPESVQKICFKGICAKRWNTSYKNLLDLSGLPALTSRRTNLKLCFLYRVLHNPSLHSTAPLLHHNIPVNVRNDSLLSLVRPFAHTNSYIYSFFPHSISLWNDLPLPVKLLLIKSFKYYLTRLL